MKKTTTISKNANNVTTKTDTTMTPAQLKAERIAKKLALETALNVVTEEGRKSSQDSINNAGKLMASLDTILANIARDVVALDPTAPVWNLELVPVTVKLSNGMHKWIEVNGLDRNARVQIIDDNGACKVHITAKNSKSSEATAYFEALVNSTQELTYAVTVRKAVCGKSFNQVMAIAKAQEQARIEKKYADICPPVIAKKATLIKKAIA